MCPDGCELGHAQPAAASDSGELGPAHSALMDASGSGALAVAGAVRLIGARSASVHASVSVLEPVEEGSANRYGWSLQPRR